MTTGKDRFFSGGGGIGHNYWKLQKKPFFRGRRRKNYRKKQVLRREGARALVALKN